MIDKSFVFIGSTEPDLKKNWLFNKLYYGGSNLRYPTFQIGLNILNQTCTNPIIIETGCQRHKGDIGDGMSTEIFAEYISRYGGKLISVDNFYGAVEAGNKILESWKNIDATIYYADSLMLLSEYQGPCNFLYLDSFDYPFDKLLDCYGRNIDFATAMGKIQSMTEDEIVAKHSDIINECQEHCLKEFKIMEPKLKTNAIVLIDDNQFYGGGKSRLLKQYLLTKPEWLCLYDLQQTLWLKH